MLCLNSAVIWLGGEIFPERCEGGIHYLLERSCKVDVYLLDGGVNNFIKYLKFEPTFAERIGDLRVVGDLDTCSSGNLSVMRSSVSKLTELDISVYPRDKDYIDLELLYTELKRQGTFYNLILGCGAVSVDRLDLTLVNLAVFDRFSESGTVIILPSQDWWMYCVPENSELSFRKVGSKLSILTLRDEAEVELRGFRYSGKVKLKRLIGLGISNEVTDEPAKVRVFQGSVYIIHWCPDITLTEITF